MIASAQVSSGSGIPKYRLRKSSSVGGGLKYVTVKKSQSMTKPAMVSPIQLSTTKSKNRAKTQLKLF